MKKLLVLMLCLFIAGLTGCIDESDDVSYFVRFKLGGQDYSWDKGYESDDGAVPRGSVGFRGMIFIEAGPQTISYSKSAGPDIINIVTLNTNTGTYSYGNFEFNLVCNQESYTAIDGTVIITKVEDSGGVVEGVFALTVSNESTSAITELTNGVFRVLCTKKDSAEIPK